MRSFFRTQLSSLAPTFFPLLYPIIVTFPYCRRRSCYSVRVYCDTVPFFLVLFFLAFRSFSSLDLVARINHQFFLPFQLHFFLFTNSNPVADTKQKKFTFVHTYQVKSNSFATSFHFQIGTLNFSHLIVIKAFPIFRIVSSVFSIFFTPILVEKKKKKERYLVEESQLFEDEMNN